MMIRFFVPSFFKKFNLEVGVVKKFTFPFRPLKFLMIIYPTRLKFLIQFGRVDLLILEITSTKFHTKICSFTLEMDGLPFLFKRGPSSLEWRYICVCVYIYPYLYLRRNYLTFKVTIVPLIFRYLISELI